MFLFLIAPLVIVFIIVIFILRSGLTELDFSCAKSLGEDGIIVLVRELATKERLKKANARPSIRKIAKYTRAIKRLYLKDTLFGAVLIENADIFLSEYKNLQKKLRLKNRDFFTQMARVHKLSKIIAGRFNDCIDKKLIKKAVEEFNAISPLEFNEIMALPYAFSLALLEFFCIHIYHARKIETIKKIAKEDAIKQRINVSYLKDGMYLYYFLRLSDCEMLSTITKVCEINDIDINAESKKFEEDLNYYYKQITAAIGVMKEKEEWFDKDFLLSLSELNKLFPQNDLSVLEKIDYYKKIAKQAKRSKLTELSFARNEIEFPKIKTIPTVQKTVAVEAAVDVAVAIEGDCLQTDIKSNTVDRERAYLLQIKQLKQRLLKLPIMDIDFFDSSGKGIDALNDFIKIAPLQILLYEGKEDSLYLLYIDKNKLKNKLIKNCNTLEKVFVLCEYIEHTKDDSILETDNLFQRVAKILLEEVNKDNNYNDSDRNMLYKKNRFLKKNESTSDFSSIEAKKTFIFYTMTKFLPLIKEDSLRKIFLKLKENLRREICKFSNLDIYTVSLAVLSDVIEEAKAKIFLRKVGENILNGQDIVQKSFVFYIAALLKKDYIELAFSLLKIFLNKYNDKSFLIYNCVIEYLLGIKIKKNAIYFSPKLPKEIAFVRVKIKNEAGDFLIEINNSEFNKKEWVMYIGDIRYNTNCILMTDAILDKKISLKRI